MTEHLQINDVAPRIQYGCDGIQAAYIYPFAVFRAADLEVWLDGVRVNSGFSVSGAGISSGGVVVFAVPPAQGSRLTLRRRVALERVSDFQTDGIIRAKTLNDELDYQVAAVQQVADDVSRCLQRPFTSASTADLSLPDPAAGRVLKWRADGAGLTNSDFDPDQLGAAAAVAVAASVSAEAAQHAAEAARETAQNAAQAASASAAVLAFPDITGHGGHYLRQKIAENGWEFRAPPQILADIGAVTAAEVTAANQDVRDQMALTNLRLMLNSLVTSGAVIQGYQWELAADEWSGGTQNCVHLPGSPGCYSNLLFTDTIPVAITTSFGAQGTQSLGSLIDGNWNGAVYDVSDSQDWLNQSFTLDLGTALIANQLKLSVSGASFGTVSFDVEGSNSSVGSGFTRVATGVAVSVAAAGVATLSGIWPNATAYRWYRIIFRTSRSGLSWDPVEFHLMIASQASNMTLVSPVVPASSAPATMIAYFLWKDDSGSAALGTHLTAELSRDGGTTWTAAAVSVAAAYDGTYSVVRAQADVSGQPAGSGMKMRLQTLNSKAQRIAAPAIYKE